MYTAVQDLKIKVEHDLFGKIEQSFPKDVDSSHWFMHQIYALIAYSMLVQPHKKSNNTMWLSEKVHKPGGEKNTILFHL